MTVPTRPHPNSTMLATWTKKPEANTGLHTIGVKHADETDDTAAKQNFLFTGMRSLGAITTELVKRLSQHCTDAPCCNFFCSRTCLNSLFFQALALPIYSGQLMSLVNQESHLEFLHSVIQMVGMDHHCKCTMEWRQKEMDYKWLGRAVPKKLKLHGSFLSLEQKLEIHGRGHDEACMGYRGPVTLVFCFPLLGNQATLQTRWFHAYKKGTGWTLVGLPFP